MADFELLDRKQILIRIHNRMYEQRISCEVDIRTAERDLLLVNRDEIVKAIMKDKFEKQQMIIALDKALKIIREMIDEMDQKEISKN